eukprot:8419186-Pyramimonas_sp.AAC.3
MFLLISVTCAWVQAGEALEQAPKIRLWRPDFGFRSDRDIAIERDPRYEIVEPAPAVAADGAPANRGRNRERQRQLAEQKALTLVGARERIVVVGWRVGLADTIYELDQ